MNVDGKRPGIDGQYTPPAGATESPFRLDKTTFLENPSVAASGNSDATVNAILKRASARLPKEAMEAHQTSLAAGASADCICATFGVEFFSSFNCTSFQLQTQGEQRRQGHLGNSESLKATLRRMCSLLRSNY